ncbi:MAG: HPr(Ser) kinase/phosphatase [Wenzhouxiangellaceae bacterium]
MQSLSVLELVERFGERLDLEWITGRSSAADRELSVRTFRARPSLVGFLNLIHPNRIQVLGHEELDWLDKLDAKRRWQTIAEINAGSPAALIVSGEGDVGSDLEELAREGATPLLKSSRPAWELVSVLQYEVARALARRQIVHGVFMEIFTIGVLITGDSGAGKSELALELLTRGHRLIADDSPEFSQMTPDIIDGTCPDVLRDCLEVRGLGVLNVRHMFGDAAVKSNKFLRLILHLQQPANGPAVAQDRLSGQSGTTPVLDLEVPRILLPVLPGRNLAVIAEAAVRNFMLRMKGFDATADFIERHGRLMRHEF